MIKLELALLVIPPATVIKLILQGVFFLHQWALFMRFWWVEMGGNVRGVVECCAVLRIVRSVMNTIRIVFPSSVGDVWLYVGKRR